MSIMLGFAGGIEQMPSAFLQMADGNFSGLAEMTISNRRSNIESAMQMRMDAASGADPSRLEMIAQQAEDCLFGNAINFPFPELLEVWGEPDLGDEFRASFACDVPILFTSGGLDVRTPTANVEEILGGFPNAAHILVDHCGHGGRDYQSPRYLEIVDAFTAGRGGGVGSCGDSD